MLILYGRRVVKTALLAHWLRPHGERPAPRALLGGG
jgi:hypothetical protein